MKKYNFEYDSDSIREILVSANPDVFSFMGLMIRDMTWGNARKTSVQFTADLTNVISAYSSVKKGRFLYLSSQEVFGRSYVEDIKEDEPVSATSFRALALAQARKFVKAITIHEECSQLLFEWIICMGHQREEKWRIIRAFR